MRSLLIAALALTAGVLLARAGGGRAPADPVQVITAEVKTHAIIEHERQVAIWYRSCPEVAGVNPEIFVAWPGKLSYELDLADVAVTRSGDVLTVKTGAIRADEPSIPTDFLDYLSTSPWLNLVNEQALVNREIARASPIARYLSVYYQRRDASLAEDFRKELAELVLEWRDGRPVRLGDIASVSVQRGDRTDLAMQNGNPAIGLRFAFDAAAASGKRAARGVIAGIGKE